MYRAVTLSLMFLSVGAQALTLSPMRVDKLVYNNLYIANFELRNTDEKFRTYDVWISRDLNTLEKEKSAYSQKEVLGGKSYKKLSVPIYQIKPDELEVYYICVQERPLNKGIGVVGRVCAKLRLYWPQSELLKLQ